MLNLVKYNVLKKIILKNFLKSNVYIYISGLVDTRVIIPKARILINKNKIVLGNDEDKDITIDLFNVRKINIEDSLRITLIYNDNIKISMEV